MLQGLGDPSSNHSQSSPKPSCQNSSPTNDSTASDIIKSHLSSANALSSLQPAQLRALRESFQVLDRDHDGVVNADDVANMLSQLGKIRSTHLSVKNF